MINYHMIELLIAFSVAVWALMSKTPIKSSVKLIATYIFNNTFRLREKFFSRVPYDDFEQYTVKFFATLVALGLIVLAQRIDMVALADNLGDNWQWIADAELISAAGVISLTPTEFPLFHINLLLTSVLIGVVGSAGIHRIEKWIAGNGLLFEFVRGWLIKNGQASDDKPVDFGGEAYGSVTVKVNTTEIDEAMDKLEALRIKAEDNDGDNRPTNDDIIGQMRRKA